MDNLLKSPKGGNIRDEERERSPPYASPTFQQKNISLSESLAIMIYYILYITNVTYPKKICFL